MIVFQDVCKTYANGTRALKNVNFTINDGEFVFIVGPSGAGKSTVVRLLCGEVKPESGKVKVGEYNVGKLSRRKVPYLRRKVGVVFQDFRLIPNKTVYENVAFVMRAVGASESLIKRRVPSILEVVGIEKKAKNTPHQISGGEKQRVAIARALVNKPDFILADEPTGNLDPARAYEIMALLNEINKKFGTTVIVITHAHQIVNDLQKRVIALEKGAVVWDSVGGYPNVEEAYDEH